MVNNMVRLPIQQPVTLDYILTEMNTNSNAELLQSEGVLIIITRSHGKVIIRRFYSAYEGYIVFEPQALAYEQREILVGKMLENGFLSIRQIAMLMACSSSTIIRIRNRIA